MEGEVELLQRLTECIVTYDVDNVHQVCEDALNAGIPVHKIVSDGLSRGMEIVGRKYEAGECFLAQLIMAGETMKEAMKILEPHFTPGDGVGSPGRVVLGTVKGDLHDLGKNLVALFLRAAGFQVVDLGIDVSAEQFIQAAEKHKPDVLGMSSLLTTSLPQMQTVVKELEKSGIRRNVKVILGGAPVSPQFGREIGSDAVAKDALDGVNICRTWTNSAT